MPWNPDYYKTGLATRAQRDAAQYNLKLKLKKKRGPKKNIQASNKRALTKDGHKNFFWPTIPTRRDA